jgi:hypothetical protein
MSCSSTRTFARESASLKVRIDDGHAVPKTMTMSHVASPVDLPRRQVLLLYIGEHLSLSPTTDKGGRGWGGKSTPQQPRKAQCAAGG